MMLIEIKVRLAYLLSAGLLLIVGRDTFYRLAQGDTFFLSKLARKLLEDGHIRRLVTNYMTMERDIKTARMGDEAIKYYSDDSLCGYGDLEFKKTDGKPLLEQQRALIVPLVEEAIRDCLDVVATVTVLEIGTGNGDVLNYLAGQFPHCHFIGIDLSVKNAELKHQRQNLDFVKGYALKLLEEEQLRGDIVFASSTFCAFTPKELEAYMAAIKSCGYKHVLISDPVVFGFKHTDDARAVSAHMDTYMWWHNYAGYLRKAGYRVMKFLKPRFGYSWNPKAIPYPVLLAHRYGRPILVEGMVEP